MLRQSGSQSVQEDWIGLNHLFRQLSTHLDIEEQATQSSLSHHQGSQRPSRRAVSRLTNQTLGPKCTGSTFQTRQD